MAVPKFARGFAQFLLRGRVVDLAVAVVIGASAGAVITSFVKDIFTPVIGALFGSRVEFGGRSLDIRGERIMYGDFVNTFLSFPIIAAVVYFFTSSGFRVGKIRSMNSRG